VLKALDTCSLSLFVIPCAVSVRRRIVDRTRWCCQFSTNEVCAMRTMPISVSINVVDLAIDLDLSFNSCDHSVLLPKCPVCNVLCRKNGRLDDLRRVLLGEKSATYFRGRAAPNVLLTVFFQEEWLTICVVFTSPTTRSSAPKPRSTFIRMAAIFMTSAIASDVDALILMEITRCDSHGWSEDLWAIRGCMASGNIEIMRSAYEDILFFP
jgi:hypothetical protein